MVEKLTIDTFKEKIFDFENNEDWQYKDSTPAVIDFYADWCGPCKAVAPLVEELNTLYDGKVKFYKVDTEDQQELAAMFNIRSIPSLLFIPQEGRPQMAVGALPKQGFVDTIKDIFQVEA
jgi:thioredoxin 1